MDITRQELMLYCRVDDETLGDHLLELCSAAQSYLRTAGVTPTPATEGQYRLTVKAMTLHYFDNPTATQLPAGLQSLINQLKFTPIYKEE